MRFADRTSMMMKLVEVLLPNVADTRRGYGVGFGSVRALRICLRVACWAVAVLWLVLWLLYPTTPGSIFKQDVTKNVYSSFFGSSATYYVLYACPVIALAIFALLYLELTRRFPTKELEVNDSKRSKLERLWRGFTRNIWTQPLVVRSPLGILTAIDLFGIALVLFVVVCFTTNLTVPRFDSINHGDEIPGFEKKWQAKLDKSGELFGKVIPFVLTLLFLPVTRGSPILRLIHVPFEHAVRYHRWLGHLTMVLLTMHGVLYCIYYSSRHETHMIMEWRYSQEGIANLPGVVGAMAGILMWVTAFAPVRTRFFNFFYGTHQLYIVLFAFYAWHVGKGNMGKCMGGVFLFFIDRFLRMVQSRKRLSGVTAQVLPSGIVELKIPVKQGFEYNALSFVYINVPGISRLEWHPFSSASSSLNTANTIVICIKPLGDWTHGLHSVILENLATQVVNPRLECPFALKLHAEGPYGHESDYFLRYKSLMLIAGGAGITPFLAILNDLLKRHELKQERLPVHVQVIWCVRSVSELSTLRDIRPAQILPSLANGDPHSLTLEVKVFVTRVDDAMICDDFTQFDSKVLDFEDTCITSKKDADSVDTISSLTPTASSQNLLMVAVILSSVAGFVLMSGLFNLYKSPFPLALDVFLFFVSTGVGIVVCGGAVLLLWNPAWSYISPSVPQTSTANINISSTEDPAKPDLEAHPATLMDMCQVTKGSRPNFRDIFEAAASTITGEETGVLICGSKGLQESVALECRSQNFKNRQAQFHFHSAGAMEVRNPGPDAVAWLTQALSGVNTLRGVELDTRHVLLQHLRSLCLVVLWILAYGARIVLALLPTLVPLPVLTSALQKLSTLAEEYDHDGVAVLPDKASRNNHLIRSPIGRALTQVLGLVNDVPSSSNKYAFLQDLADRLIEENRAEGVKLNSVNQAALRRGFARTINLLGQSLASRQQRDSFFGRLLRHLPSSARLLSLPGPLAKVRSLVGNINVWIQRANVNEATSHLTNLADTEMAEKFATELLWIAEKLLASGGMEEAVQQWSSALSLAELSLCASPKVQKSLVRLSALLCQGLVGNPNIPQGVCLQLVILWLPLLCNAIHGGDGPIFSSAEKRDAERQLERLVAELPKTDQEQVLSAWLQEYAMSQSDWPNLQRCFSSWCSSMRRLELDTPRVMER